MGCEPGRHGCKSRDSGPFACPFFLWSPRAGHPKGGSQSLGAETFRAGQPELGCAQGWINGEGLPWQRRCGSGCGSGGSCCPELRVAVQGLFWNACPCSNPRSALFGWHQGKGICAHFGPSEQAATGSCPDARHRFLSPTHEETPCQPHKCDCSSCRSGRRCCWGSHAWNSPLFCTGAHGGKHRPAKHVPDAPCAWACQQPAAAGASVVRHSPARPPAARHNRAATVCSPDLPGGPSAAAVWRTTRHC
mmetsp:Transcript_28711/g.68513  ORF Transcript_28711/g.68513 Transcript_28711/m.68513 type:complete len:248 (-) Transcript_28711:100-843(-)